MLRTILTGFLAINVGTMPHAMGQQATEDSSATQVDRGLIGLPVRSSDDQQIGLVTEAGIDDGEAILIAEIDRPLGIGHDLVVIPTEMFVNKGDHIELTITAEQVRDRLAKPQR
jgi:hypothetical protein